jgi:hypothetical protein
MNGSPNTSKATTVADNDVEALAEALYETQVGIFGTWDEIGDDNRQHYRRDAEGTLAALPDGWRLTNQPPVEHEGEPVTEAGRELVGLARSVRSVTDIPAFVLAIEREAAERRDNEVRALRTLLRHYYDFHTGLATEHPRECATWRGGEDGPRQACDCSAVDTHVEARLILGSSE